MKKTGKPLFSSKVPFLIIIFVLLLAICFLLICLDKYMNSEKTVDDFIYTENDAITYGVAVLSIRYPEFETSGYTAVCYYNGLDQTWEVGYALASGSMLDGGGPQVSFRRNGRITGIYSNKFSEE